MPFAAPNPAPDKLPVSIWAWWTLPLVALQIAEVACGDDVLLRAGAAILPGDEVFARAFQAGGQALGNAVAVSECGWLVEPHRSAAVVAMTALTNEGSATRFG